MTRTSKENGFLAKACGTVFMAVIAPVLVSVILEGLHNARVSAPREPRASAAPLPRADGPRDIFVSHGWGSTLAEARRDGLRKALCQAVAQLLARPGSDAVVGAVCADIMKDPRAVILRCEDLHSQRAASAAATSYECDVVVEFARQPLLDRLRTACLQMKS